MSGDGGNNTGVNAKAGIATDAITKGTAVRVLISFHFVDDADDL